MEKRGILHIYRDKQGFDHAARVSQLLAAGELERRAVTPEEMRAIEPTLAGTYYGGFYTKTDSTGDIHKYTVGLAAAAERLGVTIRYGQQVHQVRSDGASAWVATHDDAGEYPHRFDALVVWAGVASQQADPWVSLLDDETKLVTSRLGPDRFRVAGTAEFNGYNKDIRADRIQPLEDWVNQCFPGVNTRQVVPWAGLRPMMPDMMPRVGRGKRPNVYYNTGHGHLGWTQSAGTAHLIADVVSADRARPQAGVAPVAAAARA